MFNFFFYFPISKEMLNIKNPKLYEEDFNDHNELNKEIDYDTLKEIFIQSKLKIWKSYYYFDYFFHEVT